MFGDNLIKKIREKKSIACVGLDPKFGNKGIPDFILEEVGGNEDEAIFNFCKQIVDSTHDLVPIYKPQIAYFEQYDALKALKKIIHYIQSKNCLVILDAKRNDIGSTSEAYASYVFDLMNADATTVNTYFGTDGIEPFMKYAAKGKGIFTLVKTSNKSGAEFQDLFASPGLEKNGDVIEINAENIKLVRNYVLMGRLTAKWGADPEMVGESGYSSIGAVVGATYPEQMKCLRHEIPKGFFLIPGYGAQGGKAKDIIGGLNDDGFGAIVNSSRNVDYAYSIKPYSDIFKVEKYGDAARQSVLDMNKEINEVLEKSGKKKY